MIVGVGRPCGVAGSRRGRAVPPGRGVDPEGRVSRVTAGVCEACVSGVACAGRSQFGLRYKDWYVWTPTFPHDFVESWWLEGSGGVSVALGLFPTKGGSFGVVSVGPVGCLRGRWRSRLWKWRNGAVSRGRGQEAPRTFRCIKTRWSVCKTPRPFFVRKHLAPSGALRLVGQFGQIRRGLKSGSTSHLQVH